MTSRVRRTKRRTESLSSRSRERSTRRDRFCSLSHPLHVPFCLSASLPALEHLRSTQTSSSTLSPAASSTVVHGAKSER